MKSLTYLLAALSIMAAQTSFAQKTNVPKPVTHRPTPLLAKHRLAKQSGRTTRPITLLPPAKLPLMDSSGRAKPGNLTVARQSIPVAPGQPTVPVGSNATGHTARALPDDPNAVRVANPRLVSELRVKPYLMPLDKAAVRGSYPLGISATKTTHIIFPAKIREFDAGTDYVLAQVPESVSNVLRVKANDRSEFCAPGSTLETNMTVITDDGSLYSFLVRHQADPEVLNINMANNRTADEQSARAQGINRTTVVPVMLSSGPTNGRTANRADVSETELRRDCARLFERKGFIRRVGDSKLRISSRLKGLYVNGKVMYLQLVFQNKSDIDYDMDFVKFYLRDRDVLKRMAAQELELMPYTTYPTEVRTLNANTESKAIYALPLRTLGDDKVLEIELYERDGGRQLRFRVDSKVLLKARGI